MSLFTLPTEMIYEISSYLPMEDHLNFLETCTDIYNICESQTEKKKVEFCRYKPLSYWVTPTKTNMKMLEYVYDNKVIYNFHISEDWDELLEVACHMQQLDAIRFIVENRKDLLYWWDDEKIDYIMYQGICYNDLRMVKYAHSLSDEDCETNEICYEAQINAITCGDRIEILKWFDCHCGHNCENFMNVAARHGKLEELQHLLSINGWRTSMDTREILNQAIKFSQFHIIKWISENRNNGCLSESYNDVKENNPEMYAFLQKCNIQENNKEPRYKDGWVHLHIFS